MDLEQEAAALGWVPQDRFRGDPAKWTDAETFVSRGKEIMPILRANNAKLVETVDTLKAKQAALEATIAEANESMKEFREYHDATAKRAYEAAMKDLKAQKAAAVSEADGERVVAIDEAILELNAAAPTPLKAPEVKPTPKPADTQVHPDYAAWEVENKTWLADPAKQAYAASVAGFVRATNPGLEGRAFLDKVAEEVHEKFPPTREPANKVEGSRSAGASRGGRSYTDLPADAKAACDRMAAKLVGENKAFKTAADWRASYASNYDWS